MLNEIIKGVAVKLNAAFGDGYKIYQNDVKQGFEPPCFFVAVLNPGLEPLPGGRYRSRNPLDVRFFPIDEGDNGEMLTVACKLTEALELIALPEGGLLHGTGMNYEIADGVLHFFVSYNLTMRRPAAGDPMETLDLTALPMKGE